MKKALLVPLALALSLASFAQTPLDSALWEKMMLAYVEAMKADVQYNKDAHFAATVKSWRQPLWNVYDKGAVERKKGEIEAFLSDTLNVYTETQREQARSVVSMLDSYEAEAQAMIAAFKMTDPQMTDNLKYLTSAPMVYSYSQIYLRNWFDQSPLPAFSQSAIPYLARIADEMKQKVDSLCRRETATPELLHQFLDTEYRISTSHTKTDAAK